MADYTLHLGDCLDVMRTMNANSVDTVVCDPPYGLSFMGKNWDHGVPGVAFWQAALQVAKPGAMLLAFGGTRTHHRLMVAIEDAGWEIRDVIMWLYGSGFPKSHDISKAIDRQRNDDCYHVTAYVAERRDAAGLSNRDIDDHFGTNGMAGHWTSQSSQPSVPTWAQWLRLKELLHFNGDMDAEVWRLNGRKGKPGDDWERREVVGVPKNAMSGWSMDGATKFVDRDISLPSTSLARDWQGWGTALKPAYEPIVLAMKPLDGTFAQNAMKHGVAGLNIDGSRIGTEVRTSGSTSVPGGGIARPIEQIDRGDGKTPSGRDLANMLRYAEQSKARPDIVVTGRWPANLILDEEACTQLGEPSRFFYTAKASRSERERGLEGMDKRNGGTFDGNADTMNARKIGARPDVPVAPMTNHHPTVKPLALMRYLVRLTSTPTGGIVLDPFMGSGSTGIAALQEGRSFVGIELDGDYYAIAEKRIANVTVQPELEAVR